MQGIREIDLAQDQRQTSRILGDQIHSKGLTKVPVHGSNGELKRLPLVTMGGNQPSLFCID